MGHPLANPGWLMTLDWMVVCFALGVFIVALVETWTNGREAMAWREYLETGGWEQ